MTSIDGAGHATDDHRGMVAAAAVLSVLLTACSGEDSSQVASLAAGDVAAAEEDEAGAVDAEEAMLAFAACMRENGVEEFPDPGSDGRPDFEAMQELDRSSDEFQSASQTCADELGFQGPGSGGGFGGPGGGPGGPGGQG